MWCQRRSLLTGAAKPLSLLRQLEHDESPSAAGVAPGEWDWQNSGFSRITEGECVGYQPPTPPPEVCPGQYDPVCLKSYDAASKVFMTTYDNRCLANL
jgi:hypothetical protein